MPTVKSDTLLKNIRSYFFKSHNFKIEVAIFSAMPEELEFIRKKLFLFKNFSINIGVFKFDVYNYHSKNILLAHTGIGTTFAASMLSIVHQKFNPKYVFVLGTAGGIKQGLKVCDVLIIKKAYEAEIQGIFEGLKGTPFESCLKHPANNKNFPSLYSADPKLLELASKIGGSGVHIGNAVSSNFFPAPPELFRRLKKEDGAYSIDMESSAFYQVAWLLGIRILAIRGISNILNEHGIDEQLHESNIPGSMSAATNVLWQVINSLLFERNFNPNENELSDSLPAPMMSKL